jgi:hypothetical protein
MSFDHSNDLDRLLNPVWTPADPLLRTRLRDKTSRVMRRRRQWRRAGYAAALALCYSAGLATIVLYRSAPTHDQHDSQHMEDSPARLRQPILAEEPPQRLELLAEQADGADSARLYLSAGRKFAHDGAWDAAFRCYRNALDADPELVRSLDPVSDDWLLSTLKEARKREKLYANDLN